MRHPRTINLSIGALLGGGLLLAALAVLAQETSSPEPAGAASAKQGMDRCTECHDETEKHPVLAILKTPHGRSADPRTPFADEQCQACHGQSDEHLRKPAPGEEAPPPTVSFGPKHPSPIDRQNDMCLTCHTSGLRLNWPGSVHDNQNVACVSCHDVHSQRDPVLAKSSQPEICFECHKTQRAQLFRNSRHPVLEGQIACSDCHNPHGSAGPKMLAELTLNETCYTCHAEKRGPFLWEHAPVREDCSICHTPHGSNHDRLLKVRGPWLCQQCHLAQFHPSTAYSGTGVPPLGAAQQILGKNCLNCHSQVHGSNHPSGVRKTR